MAPYFIGDIGHPIIAGCAAVGILAIFSGGVFLSQNKTAPVYKSLRPVVVGSLVASAIFGTIFIIFTFFIPLLFK